MLTRSLAGRWLSLKFGPKGPRLGPKESQTQTLTMAKKKKIDKHWKLRFLSLLPNMKAYVLYRAIHDSWYLLVHTVMRDMANHGILSRISSTIKRQ